MSLFVINRYLGDEVDSTEDRAKALLKKLHQQAKDRQSQLKFKKQKLVEPCVEEQAGETVETKDHNEGSEKKQQPKKQKKALDETPTELENDELDAEEGEVKKSGKKKINKGKQEEMEAEYEIKKVKKKVRREDAKADCRKKHKHQEDENFDKGSQDLNDDTSEEHYTIDEEVQSEDTKAEHKKKRKRKDDENSDKGSGDLNDDSTADHNANDEKVWSEDAKERKKKRKRKHKHKEDDENSDKGSGDLNDDRSEEHDTNDENVWSEDVKEHKKKRKKKHKHKEEDDDDENSAKGSEDLNDDTSEEHNTNDENVWSEVAKEHKKKRKKKHKHKEDDDENTDNGSGDLDDTTEEHNMNDTKVQSEDANADQKKKQKHKQENNENADKGSGDQTENTIEADNKNDEKEDSKEAKVEEKKDSDAKSLLLGGFKAKPVKKVLPVLPQWLTKPSLIKNDIKQNLVPINDVPGLDPSILKKLEANKVKSFFPVQAEVIPAILDSCVHGFLVGRGGYLPKDICVSAPTGSGKTLAFVIPIIQVLMERVVCEVRALVVLPTKELAQQVCKVFNIYADGTGLKVVLIAGHKPFAKEQEMLVTKKISGFCSLADIIVCTPGRLVDHIQKTEGFTLKHLRFLVIDEADRMIDNMSQDWLPQVINAVYKLDSHDHAKLFDRRMPAVPTARNYGQLQIPLQKLLFSATLTHNPEKLQKLGLYQPRLFTSMYKQQRSNNTESEYEQLTTTDNFSLPKGLTHYYIPCNLNSKPLILLHYLLTLRFSRVLCFTNSRESSHRLYLLIKLFGGITVAEFSSRLSPGERKKTLKEFEQGKIQLLISTDATARGIDIAGVKCVINYDAPQYIRVYVHRVGRTARGGTAGLAFTMLLRIQEQRYLNMMREAGIPKLQRQPVMGDSLRTFEERYEEVLTQLQRVVKEEQAQRRF